MRQIYLAGSSHEAATIKSYASRLESSGWKIAYPWWDEVLAAREAGKIGDHHLSIDEMTKIASEERDAVLASNVLWLLAPETLSRGCWVEYGIALGQAESGCSCCRTNQVIVVSGNATQSLFGILGSLIAPTHDLAFELLITRDWERLPSLVFPQTAQEQRTVLEATGKAFSEGFTEGVTNPRKS